jgi:hypothetical protein
MASAAAFSADWRSAGRDPGNSLYQKDETQISPKFSAGGMALPPTLRPG